MFTNMLSTPLQPNIPTAPVSDLDTLDSSNQDEIAGPSTIVRARKRRRMSGSSQRTLQNGSSLPPNDPEQRGQSTSTTVDANAPTTSNNSRHEPSPVHIRSEGIVKNQSYLDNEHEKGCVKRNAVLSDAHQDVPELPQPQTQHELHEAANNLNHRTISNDLGTFLNRVVDNNQWAL